MIGQAKVPAGVRMVTGSAESLPAADDSVDFLSMGYALRHISDLTAAFREFHRVLRPGGRICVLEITRPDNVCLHSIMKAYMRQLVPLAARLVARDRNMPTLMRYYWDTIELCVAPPAILAALEAAGFSGIRRHVELGIFSEYCAIKAVQPLAVEAK